MRQSSSVKIDLGAAMALIFSTLAGFAALVDLEGFDLEALGVQVLSESSFFLRGAMLAKANGIGL